MRRRPVLAVAACLVLAACGAPHGTATLDHEPDLAAIRGGVVPEGLRSTIADDVRRLRVACAQIFETRSELIGTAGGPDVNPPRWTVEDAQCQYRRDGGDASAGPPLVAVGIVEGGTYRLHETAKLLEDEVRVDGV